MFNPTFYLTDKKSYISELEERKKSGKVFPKSKKFLQVFLNYGIPLLAVYISYVSLDVAKDSLILTKQSIDSSNKVTTLTLNYLDSISKSSNGMKSNFDSVSKKISVIPKQIDNISKTMASMDSMTSEQYRKQREEFNRKANIKVWLMCGDDLHRNLVIQNTGDAEAEITYFLFKSNTINDQYVPNRDFIISPGAYRIYHTNVNFFMDEDYGLDLDYRIDFVSKYSSGSAKGTHVNCFNK